MSCQACGKVSEDSRDACPECGASLATNGCTDRSAGGAADGRLVADGGQPSGGEGGDGSSPSGTSTGGQSTGGQPTGGQSTRGQSTGGQRTDGQASGGQSADVSGSGGQAVAGQVAASPAGGGHGTGTGSNVDVGDILGGLPLKAGALIGFFAALIPYVLVTLISYVPPQEDEFGIGAELYATIVGFGPGDEFVGLFVGGTDISALANVRPSDYPSVASELDAVIDTLRSQPETLLLPLY